MTASLDEKQKGIIAIIKLEKLHSAVASSVVRLRRDGVTLNFDLLTQKRNQVICVPRYAPATKVWRTGDIVETWKSGMHSVMPWPWTLTFWPQNLISSSLSRAAPVTKVWRKSVNRYWRYRGNIKLPRESRTDGRTDARTAARTDDPKTYSHCRYLPAAKA